MIEVSYGKEMYINIEFIECRQTAQANSEHFFAFPIFEIVTAGVERIHELGFMRSTKK